MCAQEAVKSGILDFNKQHSIIERDGLCHPRELLADDLWPCCQHQVGTLLINRANPCQHNRQQGTHSMCRQFCAVIPFWSASISFLHK